MIVALATAQEEAMQAKLTHAIKYVADMDRAVAFYRDTLGLTLRFASPGWSEFDTGEVTLALHLAGEGHPAGSAELGFTTDELRAAYDGRGELGLNFSDPPRPLHGVLLANLIDCEGAEVSLSGPL
jgi:catechol 2,3-dioxygenase-like lactoylglutathione lyase family enzyme